MRVSAKAGGISIQAISGSQSVLLAMNATEAARQDLLGFAIGRRYNHDIDWLKGFKFFRDLVPDPTPGSTVSTLKHPIQSFLWGHYNVIPDSRYDYVVRPLYRPVDGDLSNLREGPSIEISVRTEPTDLGKHAITFNRGAIPSQAFARQFGNFPPTNENDLEDEKVKWLSRGLLDAVLTFIGQARSSRFQIRAAFYEFKYLPVMEAFAAAARRGVDVKIVYEAGSETSKGVSRPTTVTKGNEKAIEAQKFDHKLLIPRTRRRGIPHNKFIILIDNGHPIQVWTGSTNITSSGFMGQSNVGHIVRDEAVARSFFDYWEQLAADPDIETLQTWCSLHSPEPPDGPPPFGITPIFSPRQRSKLLDWYGQRLLSAKQMVMITAAFGVTERLARYFDNDKDYLRFLLMEKPNRSPETQAMLARDRDTQIAIGPDLNRDAISLDLEGSELDVWLRERHYRDRGGGHIFYVHTKIMGIDLLSDDPLIFTGSANFSPASLLDNDENMLLIRGDSAVAEIYLVEFFRLFNHFYFRYVAQEAAKRRQGGIGDVLFLSEDSSWTDASFTPGRYHFRRRELLGVMPT